MRQALNLPVRQVLGIQGGTTGFLLAFDRGDVDSMISGSGWYRIARDVRAGSPTATSSRSPSSRPDHATSEQRRNQSTG